MRIIPMLLISSLCGLSHAAQMSATIYATNDSTKSIGEVVFAQTPYGLLVTPKLTQLKPGLHGFHLHQHPSCAEHGMDAGGHFDPANTKSHQGPYGDGHLGDLPILYVDVDGSANIPTLAPRLKLSDLQGLTVMVHADGDNYSDNPSMGGGGERLACGVIK